MPISWKAPVTEVYSLIEEIGLKQSISECIKNLAHRLKINKQIQTKLIHIQAIVSCLPQKGSSGVVLQ